MATDFTRISIYVPQSKQAQRPLEKLARLGEARDRSLNYMVVEAVLAYVEEHADEIPGSWPTGKMKRAGASG